MTTHDLSGATWRTSSYSNGSGGDCVEVADGIPGAVPVRDTKHNATGPALFIPAPAWTAFINTLRTRDLPTP
jgi:uncharacterized protein DUF397